ncbi:alpha/beta hydrolase [Yinghuangia seranimata]|uniref:alpha/beta hydrolase n=1 Tax=Yinghuangia seranimata TaxID=408067 RepID=UPI00248B56B3|nr:alpha/beta hydrolase [Yinghuangia seranimata]MDI2125756.1 alpha/beta hydrolase [Yinghuangia seranimata]
MAHNDRPEYGIDPQLRPLLAVLPTVDITDPAAFREARRAATARLGAGGDQRRDIATADHTVPGEGTGQPDVPVRVYTPAAEAPAPRPVLVWFHGGGYVFGGIEDTDKSAAAIARETDCVVVSVGYRLAPEHAYPAALDDAHTALTWVSANTERLGADPDRIAVGGVSAGAGLAAALALFVRDKGGPRLVFQLLDNPMIDDRVDSPSARAFTDTPLWTGPQAVLGWRYYLGGETGDSPDEIPPYAAAARATELEGLPPTYIAANEFDPLRDEDIDYGMRLLAAGVQVELHVRPGTFHGSNFLPGAEVSERARADMYAALRRAFAR